MGCACNNKPRPNYPNLVSNTAEKLDTSGELYTGVMWPTSIPVRCQVCGDDVILPDGTKGHFPCAPAGEDWLYLNESMNSDLNHAGWVNYT